jgi:hypothetical protein
VILRSKSGQMLVPMMALLMLLTLFLVGYIQYCRTRYWEIKMDVAARATALSAARSQAAMLNTLATMQLAENLFAVKAVGYAVVAPEYYAWNAAMQIVESSFKVNVLATGYLIAIANGANGLTTFKGETGSNLTWESMEIFILYPPHFENYSNAYLVRQWSPSTRKAQPTHIMGWHVCRLPAYCGDGWARLWLDVDSGEWFQNGGFPTGEESILGGLEFQSFYPQFNAQLRARAPWKQT